ncbi:chemotaxis protein CheA [Erwinia amylovora]|uniref:chemotaxis protein CheA n=1 Tax=Erwinia amylovora TaxID=552 RepID=UPI000C071572|nr:chemotaxis protein CheA [Erwinia amylovora]
MDLNDFSQVFFLEAEELLSDMEQHLLLLDVARPDIEQLNAIFRAAHSLKGGAATFGFSVLQETTHLLENLLDKARCGEIQLSRDMVNLFLEGKDIMQAQLEAYQSLQEPDEECFRYICAALQQIALSEKGELSLPVEQPATPSVTHAATSEVRLTVTLSGIKMQEQSLLLDELANLGTVIGHRPVASGIEVELETSVLADEIGAVLCFVLDESQIDIRPSAGVSPPVAADAVAPAQIPAVTAAAAAITSTKPDMAKRPSATESGSIRVAVEKVDMIINQVGELIITQSIFSQLTEQLDPAKYGMLLSSVAQLERNARELQQSVMSIRMMPMDYVFSRFPRLVHDLGARLNKEVELTLLGGAAELDKSLIERIIDPLTHLVRNSLDHGIEEKDERLRKGKSATGNLTLSAEHHGGNIVIEVRDDGAGLNREKLLAKARSRGTQIADSASDDEVWMLIFAAGFSTATNVTDVSGRGVGMDVVRRNILAMGGHVEVCSVRDQGTTIRILLPLTLAILDGMSVKVGDEIYVLPLNVVMESLKPSADMLYQFVGQSRLVQVRGEYLPLTELRQAFDVSGEAASEDGIIVIVQSGGCRYALWVDQLVGQHQVVVKNLEHNYRKVPGISAATILGDGSVALILDVIELASLSHQSDRLEGKKI